MTLHDSHLARRIDGRLETRPGGLRARWKLAELLTSDGHVAEADFSCTARVLNSSTEQAMLEEALMTNGAAVTIGGLESHFAPTLLAAARRFAHGLDAAALLSENGHRGLLETLMQSGKSLAFACGVELLPPVQFDLDCPTLRQKETVRRWSDEQAEQLRRSAELFRQFEAIRQSTPNLSPGQILSRLGIADHAELLRASFLAATEKAAIQTLWAVAGSSLIRVEPDGFPAPSVIELPTELGPARSVQPGGRDGEADILLIGCRTGVIRIDPTKPASATLLRAEGIDSQLGFNSAVAIGNRICATHGQAGLICWDLDDSAAPPRKTFDGVGSPRNLVQLGSDLLFTAARQLMLVRGNEPPRPIGQPAESEILAIIPVGKSLITIHEDGQIVRRQTIDDSRPETFRRSGRITAAGAMPWLGDARLLLAGEDGPILCAGLDDDTVTQYSAPPGGVRMVAGAPSAVAAVSPDRYRLLLWKPWDGHKPVSQTHVFGLCHHRIADIAFQCDLS